LTPLIRFGLSYTTFELSDLKVERQTVDGQDIKVSVSVTAKNTGKAQGSTVAQVYISLPDDGLTHPVLQLRGFAKAKDLAPGATTTLRIELDRLAFAYWDERQEGWKVPLGKFDVKVGQHSEDLGLIAEVDIEQTITWTGV
jgi:beta-glucosidase